MSDGAHTPDLAGRERRLTLWALRRAATARPRQPAAARAADLFRCYLGAVRDHAGARAPRLGAGPPTRDERRLLRAVAAARAGDERLLDNRLYAIALDRAARDLLAAAARAWAAVLARPSRRTDPMSETRHRLAVPETALLWAIRSWVRARGRGISAEDEIGRLFASLGAPAASGYLFGLMWVVQNAACRPLAVHCPCHGSVTADERALLDVLALTQQRDGFERLLLLRTLIRPSATAIAGQSATCLVRALNAAGLFLAETGRDLRQCAFPADSIA